MKGKILHCHTRNFLSSLLNVLFAMFEQSCMLIGNGGVEDDFYIFREETTQKWDSPYNIVGGQSDKMLIKISFLFVAAASNVARCFEVYLFELKGIRIFTSPYNSIHNFLAPPAYDPTWN